MILYDGLCYQSYSASEFRYLGTLPSCMKHLSEFGCDEVHLILPNKQSRQAVTRCFEIIHSTVTPIPIILNGCSNIFFESTFKGLGMFNRIAVNSAVWNKHEQLDIWKQKHGKQAVIANLPFRIINDAYVFFDLSAGQCYSDLDFIIEKAKKYDEVILHNLDGHGYQFKFPKELVHKFAETGIHIIISGGINEKSYSKELDLIIRSRVIDNYSLYSDREFKRSSRNVV